jgi:hypothetical protein
MKKAQCAPKRAEPARIRRAKLIIELWVRWQPGECSMETLGFSPKDFVGFDQISVEVAEKSSFGL